MERRTSSDAEPASDVNWMVFALALLLLLGYLLVWHVTDGWIRARTPGARGILASGSLLLAMAVPVAQLMWNQSSDVRLGGVAGVCLAHVVGPALARRIWRQAHPAQ